jgi:hypothetical protein
MAIPEEKKGDEDDKANQTKKDKLENRAENKYIRELKTYFPPARPKPLSPRSFIIHRSDPIIA